MRSQAYFQDIREKLIQELRIAQSSIVVAVAWFTDKAIFRELLLKAQAGVDVQLLITMDDINIQYGPDFSLLEQASGKVIKIITPDPDSVMHNKYCVIDAETVISGSYNWTKKAAGNHENITITKDAPVLASQFLDEFQRLKEKYTTIENLQVEKFDFTKINHRLQIIRYHLSLNEFEEINVQIEKIQAYDLTDEVEQIIEFLTRSYYSEALAAIDAIQIKYKELVSQDVERIFRLRMELRYLELEHNSLMQYHDTLERMINDFHMKIRLLIGELIQKLLDLKIRWAKMQAKFAKSENFEKLKKEYEQFEQRFRQEKENPKTVLNESDESEIRELYRKGVKLCHPDLVEDNYKEQAKDVFILLKKAFDNNDLNEVQRIVSALEAGAWTFGPAPADIKEVDKLEALAQKLRLKIEQLRKQIALLQLTEDYVEFSQYPSIEVYIKNKEGILKKEILYYEEKIKAQNL